MRHRSLGVVAVLVGLMSVVLAPAPEASAQTPSLVVDLGASTGPISRGASGFLYGLADPGIPSDNLIAPLRPVVAAQRAPDGLQHPNGDALTNAPQFLRNGGREIQIYMQDIYRNFPYEQPGLADYLAKVDTMVRKVVADPNRRSYVYIPFNEPDAIWYGGNLQGLLDDWVPVYQRIRSIDPTARIAGPNFSAYRGADLRRFLEFTRDRGVLPDVMTWHELGDDFFSGWYDHIGEYRANEVALGISPRPVTINEYGRFGNTDLTVPGNLVQWVTRLENSRVTGALAYWTDAGTLNDLTAATESNRATGAWWLYKWYGELTGNTVAVTPPTRNGPLQGVATYDGAKRQARVLLGGNLDVNGTFATDVTFRGVPAALGSTVHATVLGVDAVGQRTSTGPYVVREQDLTVSGGQATISLSGLRGSSAYQVILTPNTDLSPVVANRYEAEYADLGGTARVTFGTNTGYSGTYFSEGYGASNNASTNFVVTVPSDGWYDVDLRYAAGPYSGAPTSRFARISLNGAPVRDQALPGTANWNTWNTVTPRLFLTGGINRIGVSAFTNDDSDAFNVDYLEVRAGSGTVTAYEAEASGNTLAGTARVQTVGGTSGGRNVGYVGNGAGNTLTVNGVTAPAAGTYRMVVTYSNGELGSGGGAYNNNTVNRAADISVNGGAARRTFFRFTGAFDTHRTAVVDVVLAAGTNRITFANAGAFAPDIDRIQIAATSG